MPNPPVQNVNGRRRPRTPWGRTLRPSRDLQLIRQAEAAKLSQAVNVSSCRRFRSHDEPCGRLVPAVVHPLMLSSISSSTPTLCITAPDSCYSLCTTVQRSTEVSLDLDPSTPRIQLRRRRQRSRAVNDQGQEGDQWIKCSVYGWRVCMDKIRRWSRRSSAATYDHIYHSDLSVNCLFCNASPSFKSVSSESAKQMEQDCVSILLFFPSFQLL